MGFYFKPSNALSVLDQHAALPVDDNWLPDQKLSWDETTTNPLAKANIWYNTAQKGTGYHDKNKGYKKSDLYAVDLNLPTNADKGKPVFAIEDGVVSQIKTGDGYVEIEHNKLLVTYSAVVNQHAVSEDKLLYSIPSGVRELPLVVPRWYSGYMHMEIDENVKVGQVIAKGQRIGLISDIAINALPTDAHHLHFAVYDKDGYSFSPYILSSKYKLISYGGHGGWVAQDQRDHEYFPLNDLGYRNNLP
jgi:murein DD-endopeptidase MepM/ murein hydrolase activator NlpD